MESLIKTTTYNTSNQTMNSQQLLELLHFESKSSLHKKIRSMFQDKIDSGIISVTKLDTGHVCLYHLPELESKMFVAKHDINYLEQITQFWIDNSRKVPEKPALPQTYIEALEELLVTKKEAARLESETKRLNSVCNAMASHFEDGMSIVEFCRQLNGVNINKVQAELVKKKVLIKSFGKFKVSSRCRDQYFREVPTGEYEDGTGNKITTTKLVVLKKGAKWLYSQYLKGELPMKVSWDKSFTHINY